jgi:ATP-dependent Clp protease, protease subunit
MHWTTKVSPLIKDMELKHSPVIIRVNEFTEESAADFASKVALAQNTGQPIVPVIIDSYGGQVYSLMSMIAAIKASEIPVATIVEGKAMSCGVILASCGSKGHRYITEDATLMIHDVSSGAFGKNSEIQASADETQRLNEKIYQILAENTGKPAKWFHKKIMKRGRADWFVEPYRAIEIGISDVIGMPKLHIDVSVSIDFVSPNTNKPPTV